jgi:uncharacterized protein
MQLDLSQLGRHGRADEHLDRTYEPGKFPRRDLDDYSVVAPVHLVLDVHKDREAFRVTGSVQTTLGLECGRCLEPFVITVDNAFDLRYVAQDIDAGHGERELRDEDDLVTSYYRDDTLDLDELMREQFELTLPMKPLCTEACKGLCVTCGTNLNKATCDCKPTWEDPRLATLKGLLDRNKES